jgi:hypothetical protein
LKLYHLYGLAVASSYDCPELTEITPEEAVARNFQTVHVTRAQTRLELPNALQYARWVWAARDAALYEIDAVARFLVERPDRITVEMLPGAVESDMRVFLFGIAFATLVHMRGLIPLHISAIQTPKGAVAFIGPSGAGKSTRVAELHFKHGWPIICDDVAVLHPTDEQPLLHAGIKRIKLWKDAVERFGIDTTTLARDLTRADKFHLFAPEMFVTEACALGTIYEIEDFGHYREPVGGADMFRTIMNAIYYPETSAVHVDPKSRTNSIVSIAQKLVRLQHSDPAYLH